MIVNPPGIDLRISQGQSGFQRTGQVAGLSAALLCAVESLQSLADPLVYSTSDAVSSFNLLKQQTFMPDYQKRGK